MATSNHELVTSLGHTLRRLRMKRGLHAAGVAKRAGVKAALLADVEAGHATATIDALDRIARALGTSLSSAMAEARKPQPRVDASADIDKLAAALVELPPEVGDKLEVVEAAALRRAMQISGGNKSAAARLLGLERKTLVRRWGHIAPRK
jgi:transcriptional regulator with XRE-family HTH domain